MPDIIETTDAAATSATRYVLTPGQTASGTLSSTTEADGFRVTLTAGQTYTFALVGTGPQGVQDTLLRLLGPGGAEVASDDDGGNGTSSQLTFTATQSGTYVIVAGSFQNIGGGEAGTYGLSVTTGDRAHYDAAMGAGALQVPYLTWGGQTGQPTTVTWAPRSSNGSQTDSDGNPVDFIRASSAQISAFAAAAAAISEVSGLTFTRAGSGYSNSATLLVGAYEAEDASAAYALFPGGRGAGDAAGDVSINNTYTSATSLPRGSYAFVTMLHELGHAVGLAHPGEYNAAVGVDITYEQNALFIQDSSQFTVMSYFDEAATIGSDITGSPDTLLMFDILALQNLYGVNNATRGGASTYGFGANTGDVYDFARNTTPFLCIWDGGGIDTINASGYSDDQLIDLRAGYFSNIGGFTGNVSIAVGAMIEKAIGGSGRDELTGNAGDNILDGRGGADLMRGGAGNDTFYINHVGDVARENANGGVDTIIASVNFSIGANFENLMLGAAAFNGAGNGLDNIVVGNGRDNILTGNRGADTLTGNRGADTFDYNNINESTVAAFDRITDLAAADRIDLSGIDARTDVAGDNAFVLVDAFTRVSGQITADYNATTRLTTFLMDVNGDGLADMKIVANGDHDDFANFVF